MIPAFVEIQASVQTRPLRRATFVHRLVVFSTSLLAFACSANAGTPRANESRGDGGSAGAQSLGSGGAGISGQSGVGGTSGAGGVGGSAGGVGGSAGGLPPDPTSGEPFAGYDSSVTFDWPQSTAVGSCKAGHYQGSFAGIYSPAIAVAPAPIPVAGNIDLILAQSADGEFFEITDGKVSGVADLLFPFSADVKGTLNCTTSKLEGGFLSNGTYIVGIIPYAFEGPITGTYDKLSHSFTNDTWQVGEPTWTTPPPIYGGNGTWEASWVGP
jgi:hypothetical protein